MIAWPVHRKLKIACPVRPRIGRSAPVYQHRERIPLKPNALAVSTAQDGMLIHGPDFQSNVLPPARRATFSRRGSGQYQPVDTVGECLSDRLGFAVVTDVASRAIESSHGRTAGLAFHGERRVEEGSEFQTRKGRGLVKGGLQNEDMPIRALHFREIYHSSRLVRSRSGGDPARVGSK